MHGSPNLTPGQERYRGALAPLQGQKWHKKCVLQVGPLKQKEYVTDTYWYINRQKTTCLSHCMYLQLLRAYK